MSHTRRNPSQLVDPKISVVIPVYNEKTTICEILRRVEETDMRKEIVVVDDRNAGPGERWRGSDRARKPPFLFSGAESGQGSSVAAGLRGGSRRNRAGPGCGP